MAKAKARVVNGMFVSSGDTELTDEQRRVMNRPRCSACQRVYTSSESGICGRCTQKPGSHILSGSRSEVPGIEDRVAALAAMYQLAERLGELNARKLGLPTTAKQLPWVKPNTVPIDDDEEDDEDY